MNKYKIPQGTWIQAADKSLTLHPHVTKKSNTFLHHLSDESLVVFETFHTGKSTGGYWEKLTVKDFSKSGCFVFATKNPKWPYIVVGVSKVHDGQFMKPKKPLTNKQQKRMSKKSECPDCGYKEFYEGPSAGVCTNFKCSHCGSKFNATPLGIERI